MQIAIDNSAKCAYNKSCKKQTEQHRLVRRWQKGGGNGDGEGSGIADNSNTVSVVEELEYINVTVSGNEYIYDNKKVTLDELIDSIKSLDKNLPVKIADEGSSLKAYKALKAKLSENSISFIEAQ